MKKLDELKQIAKEYASKKKEYAIIDYPVFRMENEQLCLQYLVFDSDEIEEFKFKRPKEWLLQNMVTGEIIGYYNISERDYSNTKDLPLEMTFISAGSSALFDYSNFVFDSFVDWNKKLLKDLQLKIEQDKETIYEDKVLKVNEDIISPTDYVMSNVKDSLEKMTEIAKDIGSGIHEAFDEYASSLFNNIRDRYVIDGNIDYELLKQYMNFVKYSWPDFLELYNHCSNIPEALDDDYDEKIRSMLKGKNAN